MLLKFRSKMAANIFNQADYAAIQKRINQLEIQSQRQWGKMDLCQMLAHCSIQLKKALGHLPQTAFEGSPFYRTTLGRWLLLYAMPWPKGAPTPSDMNMKINQAKISEVNDSKTELLQLLDEVQLRSEFNAHPFFGQMNKKDWGRLIWKHLDHHLRQFNT